MDDRTLAAYNDLWLGLSRVHVPLRLGWSDLRSRYRRTTLGPLWIVLGTALTILAVGTVWSAIFGMKLGELFPYLTAGFIIWQLFSSTITESAMAFTSQAHIIRSLELPFSFHVLRQSMRNLVNFGHNLLIFAVVAVIFGLNPGWWLLAVIPAIAVIFITQLWLGLMLGLIGARWRDAPSLLAALMTVAFLITPVMWKPEMAGKSTYLVLFNPFSHYLEILRAPLLGMPPSLISCAVVGIITLGGSMASFALFRAWRSHIPFWM